jgi:DMSO/TMAO reductase YedYZ heme-binding membrane subunit
MIKYDLLVYLGFVLVVVSPVFGAFVIWVTPSDVDLEVRRIRAADGMLAALAALFLFVTILSLLTQAARPRKSMTNLRQQYWRWSAR